MRIHTILLLALWLAGSAGIVLSEDKKPSPTPLPPADKPVSRTTRTIKGWTVRIDDRLLAAPQLELGNDSLALLESRLTDIIRVMSPEKLVKCRSVVIVLDLAHGGLTSMQYHPSAEWLKDNGYAEDLARCVHIPVAARFTDPKHNFIQPWCVLHELAHAFHDQVLGFEEARVKQVWDRYIASDHGARVLRIDGTKPRHYAMTNHKEFFAEMSEAYFGTNDFFPFVHGELKEAEPETYALLREIWGEVAGKY